MKTYPYHFTKLVTVLLYALVALCAVCVGFTVFRFIRYALPDIGTVTSQTVLQYVVSLVVGILGLVVAISMLLRSRYELTDKQMITRFGIITSKYEIADITAVHLFTKTKKLTLYFQNQSYLVIVVKEEWYRDFIAELLKRKPSISYEESEEDKKED